MTARRAREKADFLASTDTWFRPASLATGPDGALVCGGHVSAVGRTSKVRSLTMSQQRWTGELAKIAVVSGELFRMPQHRRDWRNRFNALLSTDDLVKLLQDGNGWRRMLGQRLIVEGHRVEAERAVCCERSLDDDSSSGFRSTSCTVDTGWPESADAADLVIASQDPTPAVRRDVAKLIRTQGVDNTELQHVVAMLCNDSDGEVRMQAILSLQTSSTDEAKTAILKAVPSCLDDLWLQRALLIAAPNLAADMAEVVHKQRNLRSDDRRQGGRSF